MSLKTLFSSKRNIIIAVVIFCVIAGLAIGLGVGLTQGSSSGSGASASVGPAKLTQDQCATARRLCDSIASMDSVQGAQCRANLAQQGC